MLEENNKVPNVVASVVRRAWFSCDLFQKTELNNVLSYNDDI